MENKELIRQREKEIKRWRQEDNWLANIARDPKAFCAVREHATALRTLLVRPKIDILLFSNQCTRIDSGTRALKKIPRAGEWIAKDFYGNQVQEFGARIQELENQIAAAESDIRCAQHVLRLPQDHFLRMHGFGPDPVAPFEDDDFEVSDAVPVHGETLPKRKRQKKYHDLGKLIRRISAHPRKRKLTNEELMIRIEDEINENPDKDTTGLHLPKNREFGRHHDSWPEAYSCRERHEEYATTCRDQIDVLIAKLRSGEL